MNKLKVIILVGLPGSGKSSWAREIVLAGGHKRVNKDEIRAMLDFDKWSPDNEKLVLNVRDGIILQSLEKGFNVLVDDTNLSQRHIQRIKSIVSKKAEVVIEDKFLQVPVEECIRRDLEREKPVGKKVILDMYEKYMKGNITKDQNGLVRNYEKQNEERPTSWEYIHRLDDCIICDLDGTIAIHTDRSPYELERVDEDLPNIPVINILQSYARSQRHKVPKIILVSGREDTGNCRVKTVDWLYCHDVPYDALYMRKKDDFRKDVLVKQEIYKENIKGKLNILFVLDDRDQTIRGFRDLGLTALQVWYGAF